MENNFDDLFDEDECQQSLPVESLEDTISPKENLQTPPTTLDIIKIKDIEKDFETLVSNCQDIIEELPFKDSKDYDMARNKIKEMYNKIIYEEDPSIFDLSSQLGMVQMMKDNMLDIYCDSQSNYSVRKSIYNTLVDAYSVVSLAKSSDKRKGEAAIVLSKFMLGLTLAESFQDYCKKIIESLESQYKTLSRRIFCLDLQVKIGEIGSAGENDAGKMDRIKESKQKFSHEVSNDTKKESGETNWDDM